PFQMVEAGGGRLSQFVSPDVVRAGLGLSQGRRIEAVVSMSYAAAWNGQRLARRLGCPWALDEFNVEHARFAAMGRPFVASALRGLERRWLRRAALVSCVSRADA